MDTIKRSSLAVGVITRKNDQRQPPMGAACVAHFSGHAQHTDGVINRFRSSGAVSMSTAEQERYQRYLCSREWSEKKEAVRQRAEGYCERCLLGPMDACHHLTYARKYNEELADLQAICNGCHEFTHGKSNRNVMATGWGIYLAGKISRGDWRADVVPRLIGNSETLHNGFQVLIPTGAGIAFHYHGPFFTSMGHGMDHGPKSHGNGLDWEAHGAGENLMSVFSRSADAIEQCDVMFAWIDQMDCFGTLVEIGIAHQAGKLIVIGKKEGVDVSEMWFAWAASTYCVRAKDPIEFCKLATPLAVKHLRRRDVPRHD